MLALVPVVATFCLAGCGGGDGDTADVPDTQAIPEVTTTVANVVPRSTTEDMPPSDPDPGVESEVEKPSGPKCRTPDGTVLGSLRFRLREGGGDGELVEGEWALVRSEGVTYVAAEVPSEGPRAIVLVSFPESGQYLRGMKSINGTARTKMPDLPEGPDTFPKGAQAALDCLDE